MSWLPNPFKSLPVSDYEEPLSHAGGAAGGGSVKEDLSEIGETIGRRLLGVAAFLAPPPSPAPPSSPPAAPRVADDHSGDTRSPRLAGVRNDLAEITGSFKSSLSLLSSKKAVTGISKLASNLLRRRNEVGEKVEEDDHGVGITNEVVDFVTEISEWPECWTDFPLSINDTDFTITQAQADHISTIEETVPSLADLKIKLSSGMAERQFWMIYFILLIPRLNGNSLNMLSTPEIVEARNMLLTMLRNKRNSLMSDSKKDHIDHSSQSSRINQKRCGDDTSGEKMVLSENSVVSRGVQTSGEGTAGKFSEEEDADTASTAAHRQSQNDEEISFSDLDGDDTDLSTRQHGPSQIPDVGSYSSDGSSDWVRLNKTAESGGGWSRKGQLISSRNRDSEGEESSDWFTIREFDYLN